MLHCFLDILQSGVFNNQSWVIKRDPTVSLPGWPIPLACQDELRLNEGGMDREWDVSWLLGSCKWNLQAVSWMGGGGVSCSETWAGPISRSHHLGCVEGMGEWKMLTSSYSRPPPGSAAPPARRSQCWLLFHRCRWRRLEGRRNDVWDRLWLKLFTFKQLGFIAKYLVGL